MKIHNFTQGESIDELVLSEWEKIRKGKITGTSFKKLITPETLKPVSKKDKSLPDVFKEIIYSKRIFRDSFAPRSKAITLGNDNEDSAVLLYKERNCSAKIELCGFIENENYHFGYAGYSPDGLVYEGKNLGVIEVKTQCPKKHFTCVDGDFTAWLKEHKTQTLLAMALCPEIKFCDCISYNPDVTEEYSDQAIAIYRYHRNEEEIEKAKVVLDCWVEELKKYK